MVNGPYRPEKNKPAVNVKPAPETVAKQEGPRHAWVKQQFEQALHKATQLRRFSDNASLATHSQVEQETSKQADSTVEDFAPKHVRSPRELVANRSIVDSLTPDVAAQNKQTGDNAAFNNGAHIRHAKSTDAFADIDQNYEHGAERLSDFATPEHDISFQAPLTIHPELAANQPAQFNTVEPGQPLSSYTEIDTALLEIENSVHKLKQRKIEQSDALEHTGNAAEQTAHAFAAHPVHTTSDPASANLSCASDKFTTIEQLWRHIENMEARSSSQVWHFTLEQSDTPAIGVTLANGSDDSWVISLTADASSETTAKLCLTELETKFKNRGIRYESISITLESRV